jgi:CRISPR-associated protein Cas6
LAWREGILLIYVELRFPILGDMLPRDCGYEMYKAISRLIPEARGADWLSIEAQDICQACARLQENLKMRLPYNRAPLMLKLSGREMRAGDAVIRLAAPQIHLLKPCRELHSRCVAIRNCAKREQFLDSVARRLDEMGIKGEPESGPRQYARIGRRRVVGFALKIHDLSEEGSVLLQEQGMGSWKQAGCGYFVPADFSRIDRRTLMVQRNKLYAR